MKERLVDAAYGAGWGLVKVLPEFVARPAFQAGADLAVLRNGSGAQQLRRNLVRVVPGASPKELDDLVRAGLRSYSRYWKEVFRLPTMNHHAIAEQVNSVVVGRDVVDAALERGKGLVLALPHTGNFDVSGIWLAQNYGEFTTVAERLKPESVWERFLAYRRSLGFDVLPLTGNGSGPFRGMIDRLKKNGVVCLVADRDLTKSGIPVTFFGEETRMPAGPARLAATTGAALAVVDNLFVDDGWGLRIHSPQLVESCADVPAATQALADGYAKDIAEHPADWHMLQKLWIADLSDARREALGE
ncbi:phosphatidylinositol mannoside acyltransferase [Kibdelosporangium philippinense]|uniref:Phosphatidylinositol mannoside acyltransferase n=1 Tax=Kibdelosporangium philippinense TaxID=211113 RepID=A0ABS8ZSC8_9PSEU|nr:phosphatidylinositol mannoside acyltransferase [Kibdelosporangium philippinense]MCE7010507.1 phosphatidylinositol mannoside acyltransferase [Kibdelosporangium philippinense]